MKLTVQDRDLGVRLWTGLLQYVEQVAGPGGNLELAGRLCRQPELVDGFLRENPQLTPGQRKVVSGWKNCRCGEFFLIRFLSDGGVILTEDEKIFEVAFLSADWKRKVRGLELPVLLEGALLPFRNAVAVGEPFAVTPWPKGEAVPEGLDGLYLQARKRGEVFTVLPPEENGPGTARN